MVPADMVSTGLLFLGVLLGPVIFFATIIGYAMKRGMSLVAQYKHQRYVRSLPCSHCLYCSPNEYLKCAVNPMQVLTDEAHNCYDFAPTDTDTNDFNSYLKRFIYRSSNSRTCK
ncbi:MAG: hypothetical protein AAFQ63_06120 [Cyanobacteria bacterium J06621_11]